MKATPRPMIRVMNAKGKMHMEPDPDGAAAQRLVDAASRKPTK